MTAKIEIHLFLGPSTEYEKDGEPRTQVPEEGFKSEEGWLEILNIWPYFFTNQHFELSSKITQEIIEKLSIKETF